MIVPHLGWLLVMMGMKERSTLTQAGARLAHLEASSEGIRMTGKCFDETVPFQAARKVTTAVNRQTYGNELESIARDKSEKLAFESF